MIVNIANHDCTIVWDNVYYFALSDYPNISDWELRKLIMFLYNEKSHGRETEITCDSEKITKAIDYALANPQRFLLTPKPKKITECTACKQKGCLTDFVCHTASIENAKSIFKCGKILSAVNARGKTGIELAREERNAAKDPPDFFDYIMFAWGNCQAGDRLVMERLLGNKQPTDYDLSEGFKPGVRFYFKYDIIASHKDFTDDGYTPAKIRDELVLSQYLYCCIIPEQNKTEFMNIVSPDIIDRIIYVKNDCKDILDWSEKVYSLVCELGNP